MPLPTEEVDFWATSALALVARGLVFHLPGPGWIAVHRGEELPWCREMQTALNVVLARKLIYIVPGRKGVDVAVSTPLGTAVLLKKLHPSLHSAVS